jgi:hypothetical protein
MPIKNNCVAIDFYHSYINLIKEDHVEKALKKNTSLVKHVLKKIPASKIDYAYAENKWTIKQLLQHMIDAERVFSYRALTFARKDLAQLPGFDEKLWAENAKATDRKWKDLVDEFKSVRKSTELLFGSFDEEELLLTGVASSNNINVLALGFVCAGHAAHHMYVIKERYL